MTAQPDMPAVFPAIAYITDDSGGIQDARLACSASEWGAMCAALPAGWSVSTEVCAEADPDDAQLWDVDPARPSRGLPCQP